MKELFSIHQNFCHIIQEHCSSFLLWEICTPSIFPVSFVRLKHFMPQGATFNPFSVPIPAISHSVVIGLTPETRENLIN